MPTQADRWTHLATMADDLDVELRVVEGPGQVKGQARPHAVAVWGWRNDEDSYWVALHELGHVAHGHPQERKAREEEEAEAWEWAMERSLIPVTEKVEWTMEA